MLDQHAVRVEELRQAALRQVRSGDYAEALALYDEALAMATDEEVRELITINKADAMIALERTGPEVNELPSVIMRRRNFRHVYLAAYALQYKHRLENDLKRALFYGQLALRTAEEANEPAWRRIVLLELGKQVLACAGGRFLRPRLGDGEERHRQEGGEEQNVEGREQPQGGDRRAIGDGESAFHEANPSGQRRRNR